jgi:hypothetical protein
LYSSSYPYRTLSDDLHWTHPMLHPTPRPPHQLL